MSAGFPMTKAETSDAGTDIYRPTLAEYEAFLDQQTEASLGLTFAEFKDFYFNDLLDADDPSVSEAIALVSYSQSRQ